MFNWLRISIKSVSVTFICSFSTPLLMAGHETHGGDLIYCSDSPSVSEFKGYYNYDYLLTYKLSNKNADIVMLNSWLGENSYSERLLRILKTRFPEMHSRFAEFLELRDNETDPNLAHKWEESAFGLIRENTSDMNSELYQDSYRRIPKNCYHDFDPKQDPSDQQPKMIHFERAISKIDSDESDLVKFAYDPRVIAKVEPNGEDVDPLVVQLKAVNLSFLMVHEFLRLFTNEPKDIREANRLLHSKLIDADNYDLARALDRVNVRLYSLNPVATESFSLSVNGPFIGSFVLDEARRTQAIEGFVKKCEAMQTEIRKNLGQFFESIDRCDLYSVVKVYRRHYRGRALTRHATVLRRDLKGVKEPYRVEDLESHTSDVQSKFLGYRVYSSLKLRVMKKPGSFTEEFEINNLKSIPIKFSDDVGLVNAFYQYERETEDVCSKKINDLREDLGTRLKLSVCIPEVPYEYTEDSDDGFFVPSIRMKVMYLSKK